MLAVRCNYSTPAVLYVLLYQLKSGHGQSLVRTLNKLIVIKLGLRGDGGIYVDLNS